MSAFGAGPPSGPSSGRMADWTRMRQLAEAGRFAEAIAVSQRHLKPGSRDVDFMRARARLERHAGDQAASVQWATAAERIQSHPETLLILGRGHMKAGRTDQAVDAARAALTLDPGNARALLLLAETFESAMRLDEAWEALDALRSAPGASEPAVLVRAWFFRASVMVHRGDHGAAVELLDREVLGGGSPDRVRRQGWYLRAKACDRAARWEEAFESASQANAIGATPFDPQAWRSAVEQVMAIWTRERMREFPSSRSESQVPVFIAGMPRSGTSLLDQVIDAHAQAAGVGELKELERFAAQLEEAWDMDLPVPERFGSMRDRAFRNAASAYLGSCTRLAPGALRVVNKALGNNRILGLLARIFPQTRVVHALRDPRDVAVSCFLGGFNNASLPWSTRLEWIAEAWIQSRRLMEHWERELDVPMLEVRYESLVTDPASEFPRLVEFLGLPWDEGCRQFHQSNRTVRTLSYDQVNRPLYATSVARWRNYERFLSGVDWPRYP